MISGVFFGSFKMVDGWLSRFMCSKESLSYMYRHHKAQQRRKKRLLPSYDSSSSSIAVDSSKGCFSIPLSAPPKAFLKARTLFLYNDPLPILQLAAQPFTLLCLKKMPAGFWLFAAVIPVTTKSFRNVSNPFSLLPSSNLQ